MPPSLRRAFVPFAKQWRYNIVIAPSRRTLSVQHRCIFCRQPDTISFFGRSYSIHLCSGLLSEKHRDMRERQRYKKRGCERCIDTIYGFSPLTPQRRRGADAVEGGSYGDRSLVSAAIWPLRERGIVTWELEVEGPIRTRQ